MNKMKEVRFDIYCITCKYWDLPEICSPCDECLGIPTRDDSHKPYCYESKEEK